MNWFPRLLALLIVLSISVPLLAQEKVTILNQTPSAFQQLIEADLKQIAPPALALRKVIFGGEALNQAALGF